MSLVRFDVSHEIEDLRREVNRVFAGLPMMAPGSLFGAALGNGFTRWLPAMDTVQENGKLSVTLDLPGMTEKDVDVEVEGDILTIRGSREIKREKQGQEWYRHERFSGEFERSLHLPEGIDPDRVAAKFDRGVLTVTVPVPKKVVTGSRHIAITTSPKG